MLTPRCPDHGPLILELALGRLDDAEAVRAEQVRSHCDSCRQWWMENLQGEAAATVDAAVGEVFSSFDVPRRRRSQVWWVAAAAAVVVLSVGLTWHLGPSGTAVDTPRAATAEVPTAADESISGFDFELGDFGSTQLRTARADTEVPSPTREAARDDPAQAVFTGDFESGTLGVWTPNT